MTNRTTLPAAALGAASVLLLAGCSGAPSDAAETDAAALQVVASASEYGQIAEEIGGDAVEVISIVSSASQDPHSYEASARDQLTIQRADLIIENGGGYDPFVDALIDASGVDAPVVTAVEHAHDWPENEGHDDDPQDDAAHDHDHDDHDHVEGFNEHVWYDPEAMGLLAEAAAERLAELDPENEQAFRDNAASFNSGIQELEDRLAEVRAAAGGRDVAMTEPVPAYLLEDAGLHNVTPDDFTEAVEEGQDVPPAVLKEMQDLMASGDIAFLAYNEQTSTSQTEAVRSTAEDAGIPVVDFSETLPEGEDFLAWMNRNVKAIQDVLK